MSRAQGRAGMRRQLGFTLIELMIVVTIIGVLAVVAGSAYKRYSASGRNAEAMAMIGEFKTKEEAYKAEFNTYLPTGSSETNVYPAIGSCPAGQVEPCPKVITPLPASWVTLGISANKTQLYCGYVAITTALPPLIGWGLAGPQGQTALGGTAPIAGQQWFYVRAECDNNRLKVPENTTFIMTGNNSAVITLNEGF